MLIRRVLLAVLAVMIVTLAGPRPGRAGGALIETTVPLADRTDDAVEAAVVAALEKAVRGAVAMGFPWFRLRDAHIRGDEVAVRIMATDQDPAEGSADDGEPEPPAGSRDEAPAPPAPAGHGGARSSPTS